MFRVRFITHWPFLEKKLRASSKASLFSSCPFPVPELLVGANMQTETAISPDSFAWVKFSVSFGLQNGNLGITSKKPQRNDSTLGIPIYILLVLALLILLP